MKTPTGFDDRILAYKCLDNRPSEICPDVATALLAMLISTQVKLARLTSVRFIDFWALTPGYISIKILSPEWETCGKARGGM